MVLISQAKLQTQWKALVLAIGRTNGILGGDSNAEEILQGGDLRFCMETAKQLHHLNQMLDVNRGALLRTPKEQS